MLHKGEFIFASHFVPREALSCLLEYLQLIDGSRLQCAAAATAAAGWLEPRTYLEGTTWYTR